jgi:hypothetical protein
MSDHTQNFIWAWIHQNQWWWTVMQFFTLFISVRILRLAPALTLWGRAIRMLMLAGLMMYSMSYWNSGLSVPATGLILLGMWLWVEQLISMCLKAGHIKRSRLFDAFRGSGSRAPAVRHYR